MLKRSERNKTDIFVKKKNVVCFVISVLSVLSSAELLEFRREQLILLALLLEIFDGLEIKALLVDDAHVVILFL